MKELFIRYKWSILAYIIYAAFVPTFLDNGLELRHSDFWYGILICYFAIPLIIYTVFYVFKYYIKGKSKSTAKDAKTVPITKENESWTLMDFARQHGRMKVHRNSDGLLDICTFTDNDNKVTKAYIALYIKNYNVEDIQREKNELSIITLSSGAYCLCKKWETVNLI